MVYFSRNHYTTIYGQLHFYIIDRKPGKPGKKLSEIGEKVKFKQTENNTERRARGRENKKLAKKTRTLIVRSRTARIKFYSGARIKFYSGAGIKFYSIEKANQMAKPPE